MWVYSDMLQIEFTFRSGPMIFGWVMVLGLWNLAKYLIVTTLFHYDLRYWLDFWYDYESVYNPKLQILKFVPFEWFLANLQPFGLWNLVQYLVVTTLFHYDLRYWLDFLVWECIIISYRSTLKFVPVEWFLANYSRWALKLVKYLVVITFFSLWFEILTWFLVCELKEAWGYRS